MKRQLAHSVLAIFFSLSVLAASTNAGADTNTIDTITGSSPSSAQLGTDLIINGDFNSSLASWSAVGWSWHQGSAQHLAGKLAPLSQQVSVTRGTTYLLRYTLSGAMHGSTRLTVNGTPVTSYNTIETDSAGLNSATWSANATGKVLFAIEPSPDFDSAIDNISFRPIISIAGSILRLNDAQNIEVLSVRGAAELHNTGIGKQSLQLNTTGADNTAVGAQALAHNIVGFENTAVGSSALQSNGAGYANTASGTYSLRNNSSGFSNTAFGAHALECNTAGAYNTAIGLSSMYSNIRGFSNVAVGVNALYSNTSGNYSIAIGSNALSASSAGQNVAIGIDSMPVTTTGVYNCAVGQYSLFKNTTGNDNCAFGIQAIYDNTTGSGNSAFGSQALNSSNGSYNTAIGKLADGYHLSGDYNTSLGYQAGVTEQLANRNLSGKHNVWLGANAGPGSSLPLTNSIAVGYQSHATLSNQAVFGNPEIETTLLFGKVGVGTTNPTQSLSVGSGFGIAEGENAAMGAVWLVAGKATVNNTRVTANSRVFLSIQSLAGVSKPQTCAIASRIPGKSFSIVSSSELDSSHVAYLIIEPN